MADVIDSRVVFAKQVLGLTIFPYQEEALETRAPITNGVAGRRAGKTLIGQVRAINTAMTKRNVQVIAVGPNESSTRRWVAETADLIARSKLSREATFDIEARRIVFLNGSEILGIPPTASALRGYGRKVAELIVDEHSLCAQTLWADLRFIAADNQAPVYMAGPPLAPDGHWAKDIWLQGQHDDGVFTYQWKTEDNPLLDRDWLRRERANMNHLTQMCELDGLWIDGAILFYPPALLNAAVADIEPPAPWDLLGPARGILSADFGLTYDQSCLWFLYRAAGIRELNPDHGKPTFIAWPHLFEPGTPLLNVVNTIVDIRAPFLHYAPDVAGLGGMPSQEIVRRIKARPMPHGEKRAWWLRPTTNQTKVASHGLIRWLLENQQLILPRDPQLIRQFLGMRFEAAGHGGTIENSSREVHDDIPSAAALSTLAYVPTGTSRVITALQDLAGEKAVPDSLVHELDEEIVTTGGGLRLYKRPVLQSVADNRVTLPAGAGPKVYRDTRYDAIREQVAAAIS